MRNLFGKKFFASLVVLALAAASVPFALAIVGRQNSKGADPLSRFAHLSFGASGSSALNAIAKPFERHAAGPNAAPVLVTEYQTPNGWLLRPAGTQIDASRAPTGVIVSPDGNTAWVVNSGIFEEALEGIDAATLQRTLSPASDLYLGVAQDANGNLWASSGSRNKIWQYKTQGAAAVPLRNASLWPGTPNFGIPATGYPGSMTLGTDGRLYVAGNLSVPSSVYGSGPRCVSDTICSAINIVDVTNPNNPTPSVKIVPVGRDAFGLALNEATGKLYVSNWADETGPRGIGSVSVVDVSTHSEHEVQRFNVGHHPTSIALSPDRATLAVANSADDTVSLLSLNSSGNVVGSSTISAKTSADAPKGATPLSLAYTADGAYLLIGLAGQNAVEVRHADGSAISRNVTVGTGSNAVALNVPNTYIPTGWYPSAMAVGPKPGSSDSRLYVTNLKGIGGGPGMNGDVEPFIGSRTQGSVSAIDIPSDSAARDAAFDTWTATTVENNNWVTVFDPALKAAADDPCLAAPLPNGTARSQLICDASTGALDPHQLHVVYVIKENKTFDQFFGDLKASVPDSDADPTWLLYGQPVTTNQHNLAKTFAVGDNFWANSDVSEDGHQWTSAGYATDAVEMTWNQDYDQGLRGNRGSGQYQGYAASGDGTLFPKNANNSEVAKQEGELQEPSKRLIDSFAERTDLTYRLYSDDVNSGAPAEAGRVPLGLWGLGSSAVHHGRDLDFPDTDRVAMLLHGHTVSNAWSPCPNDIGLGQGCTQVPSAPPSTFGKEIGFCGAPHDPALEEAPSSYCNRPNANSNEFDRFTLDAWTASYNACRTGGGTEITCQSSMPNFMYVALPVDHTLGFNPMDPTPASMVADNDYAVGKLIEGLSQSPFWKTTIVMIVEDDTQAAGDHVDAHRTFVLTAGGLAKQHGVAGSASHQAGSFASLLKTIEILFGLDPLTIYDKGSAPLHDLFVNSLADANSTTYTAEKPPVPFMRNGDQGILSSLSMSMNWSKVDLIDEQLLNALLYSGIKGWPLPTKYKNGSARSSD